MKFIEPMAKGNDIQASIFCNHGFLRLAFGHASYIFMFFFIGEHA